jgi:hypothetical protein
MRQRPRRDSRCRFGPGRAKNPDTYSLTNLPAGKYELTVAIPGLKNFSKKDVGVLAGKTERIDTRLEETTQISTLGEDTLAIQADAKKHASVGFNASHGGWKTRSFAPDRSGSHSPKRGEAAGG